MVTAIAGPIVIAAAARPVIAAGPRKGVVDMGTTAETSTGSVIIAPAGGSMMKAVVDMSAAAKAAAAAEVATTTTTTATATATATSAPPRIAIIHG